MAKKKKKSKNMMERYHGPLIENEVVLGYIKLVPWLTLVISGMIFWGMTIGNWTDVYRTLFEVCIYYSAFAIVVSFFDKFILKFKIFVYLLISLIFVVLTIDISCINLLLISQGGVIFRNDGSLCLYSNRSVSIFQLCLCMVLFAEKSREDLGD